MKKIGITQRSMERVVLDLTVTDRVQNVEIRRSTRVSDAIVSKPKLKWNWIDLARQQQVDKITMDYGRTLNKSERGGSQYERLIFNSKQFCTYLLLFYEMYYLTSINTHCNSKCKHEGKCIKI